MSRGLRRSGLAVAAGLVLAMAVGCSSTTTTTTGGSAGSSAGVHGTLTVFGAGTLATPFAAELQAFRQQNPGVTIHSQFAASGDMVKRITQLGQPADVAIYRSNALEEHLKYIALPAQLNLSDSAMAAAYAKVTVHTGSLGARTAKPIIYGLTIPSTAPDPALAQKFIGFVLSPQGQAIMSSNGFMVISPALASSQASVPASLRSLTTPWPAAGG